MAQQHSSTPPNPTPGRIATLEAHAEGTVDPEGAAVEGWTAEGGCGEGEAAAGGCGEGKSAAGGRLARASRLVA